MCLSMEREGLYEPLARYASAAAQERAPTWNLVCNPFTLSSTSGATPIATEKLAAGTPGVKEPAYTLAVLLSSACCGSNLQHLPAFASYLVLQRPNTHAVLAAEEAA